METAFKIQQKWEELTQEEKNKIFKKLNAKVKIKFTNNEIIGFNPFTVCCSLPTQYTLKIYTNGNNMAQRI